MIVNLTDPIARLALRMWRERERCFPAFVRHDPDAMDLATGAWQLMYQRASAKFQGTRQQAELSL